MSNGTEPCVSCGSKNPWMKRWKKEKFSGCRYMECNNCFDASNAGSGADVYFREPYWDDNLHDLDDPSYDPQRGTFVTSKAHKAYLFKKLSVREAGDPVHGTTGFDPLYSKHALANSQRR